MSINPKNKPTQAPTATPAPKTEPVAVQSPVIEHRPASEANGYLDPDQTLVNFAVRELGYSFERIIKEDPNRLLRSWSKVYRKAKTTAIGTATLGACAVIMGVLTGATPMMVAGVLVAGASGLLVKRHAAGVESCDIEHEVLDDCRPVLAFLAELERRGVNPSDLVSLYDRVIKRVSVNPGRFGSANILQRLFKDELEQSGVLAQVSGVKTGLASVAAPPVVEGDRVMALPESQPIGMNTRFGAIPAAVAVPPEPIAPKVQPSNAFAKVLSDPFESRAIFGSQRTGKSLFAAVCATSIAAKHKTQIFHLNLASFGDEDLRYWKNATLSIAADLSAADEFTARELIKNAGRLVQQFYATPNSILIVDEIATIGSTSNRYKALLEPLMCLIADKITTLASSGKKRRQAIWTIAPEFVAGGLSQDAKAVKKLSLCYLTIAPGRTVDWQGQDIGCRVELYRQLDANFSVATLPREGSFNCDRIAMIDGQWMPIGDLPTLATPVSEARQKLETLLSQEAIEPTAAPEDEADSKASAQRPNISKTELGLTIAELSEWIDETGKNTVDDA